MHASALLQPGLLEGVQVALVAPSQTRPSGDGEAAREACESLGAAIGAMGGGGSSSRGTRCEAQCASTPDKTTIAIPARRFVMSTASILSGDRIAVSAAGLIVISSNQQPPAL